MKTDAGARLGTTNRRGPRSTRLIRRASRVVSAGLLVLATAAGVRLGLAAPAVSPVSPAAIAARYGTPPGGALPASPGEARAEATAVLVESAAAPVEAAAVLPADATALTAADAVEAAPIAVVAAPSSAGQAASAEHRRGQHAGGGHD